MTLRRPSWSSSCLRNPTPLILRQPTRVGPARQWRKSGDVERRRSLASLSPHGHSQVLFQNVLTAIQRKDLPGTSHAFFRWMDSFDDAVDASLPAHHEYFSQFHEISGPVMSEILRSMDPVERPELDVVHSLSISQGHTWSTDVGKYIDDFGVRIHHRRALDAVKKIMELRRISRIPLQPSDFDVILRIVGAAVDYTMAPIVMDQRKSLATNPATNANWIQFLKARFMTEPVYYQNNRSHMVVTARQRVNHEIITNEPDMVSEMDRIRYSINHLTRKPWNRRRDKETDDIRRLLRRGEDNFRGYMGHWLRMQALKVDIDVEFLSVSIEGFARSDSRQQILELILRDHYGIRVDEQNATVTGGFDLPADSAIYPTPRLQQAIVEAFGSMGDISLAMQLVDFISQRYGVPISPRIWSNLLSWTYVCASKGEASFRRKWTSLSKSMPDIKVADVLYIWNIMTSPPYNIEPSFEDLAIYIRATIIAHRFQDAVRAIRERAVPFYDLASQELEEAIEDEVMLYEFIQGHYPSANSAEPDVPPTTAAALNAARRRRREAEVHKDYVTNLIALCFDDLLKQASKARGARTSTFPTVDVPHLLRDFPQFFFHGAKYRTATGKVSIEPPAESVRFHPWSVMTREALTTKLGGAEVKAMEGDEQGNPRMIKVEVEGADKEVLNPEFIWPQTPKMLIKEARRQPRTRRDVRPPSSMQSFEAENWRVVLERQLLM